MLGASITARLGLDTAGFKAGIKEAQSALSTLGGSLGASLSIAGGVAILESATKAVIEYGARIQDLSTRFNVDAVALQKLGNAAELHGSSLESVAKGFNKLEIASSRALGGNEQMVKAFNHLGISVEDLKKLSPEQLMVKLGKSSGDAADMVKILGRNALELRPTLEGLADGTIKFGTAIDGINIKKLKEADDLFKQIGQGAKIGLGGELARWIGIGETGVHRFNNALEVTKDAATSAWESLKLLFSGEGQAAANKIPEFIDRTRKKVSEMEKGIPASDKGKKHMAPDGTVPGTLSIKDLAEHGAKPFGSPQMIWEASQAREALRLEEQAHQYDLTGISWSGEISEDRLDATGTRVAQRGLRGRAADIRASIPSLTDKDKFKDALKTTEETLAAIKDNTDDLSFERQ